MQIFTNPTIRHSGQIGDEAMYTGGREVNIHCTMHPI